MSEGSWVLCDDFESIGPWDGLMVTGMKEPSEKTTYFVAEDGHNDMGPNTKCVRQAVTRAGPAQGM